MARQNMLLVSTVSGLFAFGFLACTSSDFAGTAKRGSNFDAKSISKSDLSDGDDESGDGNDSGGSDSGGGGAGGSDSGNDSGGKVDSGSGDSADSGGIDSGSDNGTVDSDDDDDNGGSDLSTDNGTTSATLYSDLQIARTREDQKFQIKIELKVSGKVVKTETKSPPKKGSPLTVAGFCRKGKSTKFTVTIIGKSTMTTTGLAEDAPAGTSTCIYKKRLSSTSYQLDFDPGGYGGSGSNCGKGEDDIITLTCSDSTKLNLD